MSKKVAHNLLTIFIELSQNMMNYSKQMASNHLEFNSKGLIVVGFDKDNNDYYIYSRNRLLNQDKEKITPRIEQVLPLDKDALKKLYRTLRKSGKDKHERGAGIGFIEIARRCDGMEYHFNQIDETSHYFAFKVTLHNL